jgi:glucose/arabinose dehydrogenase
MRYIFLLILVLLVIAGVSIFLPDKSNNIQTPDHKETMRVRVVATNLEVPWALAFLPASPAGGPDGQMLVTERPGRVRIVSNGNVSEPIAEIRVHAVSEGGLHGIAVDPDFNSNNFVYLYYTYADTGNNTLNRVVRYIFENNNLREDKIIVDRIPGAPNHNGGRIKFGPDGFLYITTGDAQEPTLSQDRNSLAGKILRVTRNGDPAPNNPFGTLVYSYGHRNSQGIAWDNHARLWATEHGRSPGGLDELNIIERSKNYGWPIIQGDETQGGMEAPIINSGSDTWAPAGAAFINGSIFFAGLRGQALYEYKINEQRLIEHFKNQYGRLRDVVLGPDNMLYVTTSNRDGRGNPQAGDDKILLINPAGR